MRFRRYLSRLISAAALTSPGCSEAQTQPYIGWESRVLTLPGCNASAFAQLPNDPTLFIGRQLLTADGVLGSGAQTNDCSGGNPNNQKVGKSFNRWSLMLDRLNWGSGRFEVVKPLLDTSLDPSTGVSRTQIVGGPMSGAIIRSAYDPSIAVHDGVYYVSYECTIQNGARYGVNGTSSCISVYDPRSQTLDMSRTRVLVTGVVGPNYAWAAAIPHLLSSGGRLYLYWSASLNRNGQVSDRVRAAELVRVGNDIRVKGSDLRPVAATTPLAVDVWVPGGNDPTSGNILDLFGTFEMGNSIYVTYATGGAGCFSPAGSAPGCYHLAIARLENPLEPKALNKAAQLKVRLPSNPVEYAVPVRDPSGRLFLMGHFIRPAKNGYSELSPMPNRQFWDGQKGKSVFAIAPLSFNSQAR